MSVKQQVGLPTNKNQLSPLGFRFSVKKLPHVNFFANRVNLPGLNGSPPNVATPFRVMPLVYDKLDYEDLQLTFKVDEDLRNYQEIQDWMVGIGFPTGFNERRFLENTRPLDGKYSDGILSIQTSKKNHNVEYLFRDLLPYSLSGLEFNTTDADVQYIEATVTFKYQYYTLNR